MISLALLLALGPVQDDPSRVPVPGFVDIVRLVRDVDGKAPLQHVHGVDDVLGLAGMLSGSIDAALAKQAAAPLQVTGAREFAGQAGVEFRANEPIKIKVPYPPNPGAGTAWGIGFGTVNDWAFLGVTSSSYGLGGEGKLKGADRNTVLIYVPPTYSFAIIDGMTRSAILTGSGADGVKVDQITAKRYVGAKSLVPLRWTIPAASIKAGTVGVSGPEILPYAGTPARVTAVLVPAPGTAGPAVGAGDLVVDLNAGGKTLWADQSARPTLNAARPSGTFGAGLELAPFVVVVQEGVSITLDVDAVPASIQPGATLVVVAWFSVNMP